MPMYRTRPSGINTDGFNEGLSALAKAYAPATPQEMYLSQKAATERANASRIAELYSQASDPNVDQVVFDRRAGIAGAYNPNQSMTAVNANNATTLRTNAADNATRERTNAADNRGKLAVAYAAPITAREGETVYLPNQTRAATGLPGTISGAFTLKPDERKVLPDGRELQGNESPPTLEQVKGAAAGRMSPELQAALAFGSTPTPTVQGANGPVITTAPQSIGQSPAPAAVAPSNISRLQAERAALQARDPADPRIA
ncbi:hypothetical protein FV219_06030, partial [Methylobacterium sp. WL122]